MVKEAEQKGGLSKPQAASLHGALNFATGFMMGRHFKPMLMSLLDLPAEQDKSVVSKSLSTLRLALEEAGDKVIQPGTPSPPVLIFTDAAWESGKASAGVVISDPADGLRAAFELVVPNKWVDE